MDWISGKTQILETVKKYRYVPLVLLAGILLMLLPQSSEEVSAPELPQYAPNLQESLSGILSQMSGAGKVEVLLTQAVGEETIYQTDENRSSEDLRLNTVVVTDPSRAENGLIRQINPPVYLGAVVLCQGADSASIRLSLVEAVASATGLTSDRITVLKMK